MPSEALELAIAGCSLVLGEEGERRCYLGKGDGLRVFVPEGGGTQLRARLDGEELEVQTLLDGRDLVVRVEQRGPGVLEISSAKGRWRASLRDKSPGYYAAYEAAAAAYEREGFEGFEAALGRMATQVSEDERALFACFATGYAYASGSLDGYVDALAGNPSPSCRGVAYASASHGALYEQPDLARARRLIAAATQAGREDFSAFVGARYYEAGLRLSEGDIDEALATLERVVTLSAALDDLDQLGSAQVTLAVALARLGRFEEALRLAEDARAVAERGGDPIIVTEILDNIAWLQLLRREDDPRAADPSEALRALIDTYVELERGDDLARTRLHLSLAAVQTGDSARAQASLAAIDKRRLTPIARVWFELVSARAARLERRFDAAAEHLERATLIAELHEDPELDWYVLAATAGLARADGREQQALAAYERAANLASALALSVPGSAGRSMMVTSRSRVDAEHVELLLALGRTREAACVAAGTRARHLRALWARLRPPLPPAVEREYRELLERYGERRREIDAALEQAWSLSRAELEQLRARLAARGEQAKQILERATALLEAQAPQWSCEQLLPEAPTQALLTMAPSPDESQWVFMLARGEQVESLRLDAGEGELAEGAPSLAAAALEQLAPRLEGATSVTIVPVAAFVSVDFHALLLARSELAGLRVRYSLGLGERREDRPLGGSGSAAVVGGEQNLDAVREEVVSVSRTLATHGLSVSPSWSPSDAPQPALLHFAGHGYREGLGGWESYIELPGYGRLSATKLVAEQRAPALVVLGACSAGSSDGEIVDGGMNLAAAFLLAGAELVIAASGPVDDAAALTLAKVLYRDAERIDAEGLDAALVATQQRELAGQGPAPLGSKDATTSSLRWRAWVP